MYSTIRFEKYKSFSSPTINSLSGLKRVNIFIGQNNSGKSSIIDVIGCTYGLDAFTRLGKIISGLEVETTISSELIDKVFKANGHIGNYRDAKHFCSSNSEIPPVKLGINYKTSSLRGDSYFWDNKIAGYVTQGKQRASIDRNVLRAIESYIISLSQKFAFRRLSAERNIVPESESETTMLDEYGNGASNLIRLYLSRDGYDEKIIEETLLGALNEIMYPDAIFRAIRVQQVKRSDELLWEVFLQEEGSERYALSQSGSGLKTIILLLLNLLIIPEVKKYDGKKMAFAFEELENNLHPYLQRRTFEYIYKFALENDIYVFVTTHSHVAINTFYGKDEAALFHITKKDGFSESKIIDNHIDKVSILNDLDVKASDLFQSNGIIWVEGASDRVYINRWLEIFCNSTYKEGEHYQFLYYGGSNLSHYTCSDRDVDDLINILTTNVNAAIIMDSDKRYRGASISAAKTRVRSQFEEFKMFAWITSGKEIENYIPYEAINATYGCKLDSQCGRYEIFPEYISGVRKNFNNEKVQFAHKVADKITIANSSNILDLAQQIKKLFDQIKHWNK